MTDHRLTDRDRALLVGLADGTLRGRRRARAEARAHAIPGAVALIDQQRRVARALHDGPAPAPPPTARAPALPAGRPLPVPRLAAAGALAVVLLLAVTLVWRPDGGQSVIAQAADLAKRPATATAPPSAGRVLRAGVEGVAFPDWEATFGWHAIGARRDDLGGRAARTVFYEHMGHRIAYTILPGPPLDPPRTARVVRRDGLDIALYRDPSHGGHDVAVFERGGRTCVLAGHVLHTSTLVELAAWTGGGAVRG